MPAASTTVNVADGSDPTRLLKVNADGSINVTGGGGTGIATDPIWDAAGDLVQATGADAAARLAIGASGSVLTSTGTAAAWATPGSLTTEIYEPAVPATHSLLGWSHDPQLANGALSGPGNGVLNIVRIAVPKTISVTNVIFALTAASGTPTAGQNFMALFDSTGARIGVTADQTAAWGTSGVKVGALAGGPFPITGGVNAYCWAVILSNASGAPTLAGIGVNTLGATLLSIGLAAGASRYGTILTGQTTVPASFTPGSVTAATRSYWAALS